MTRTPKPLASRYPVTSLQIAGFLPLPPEAEVTAPNRRNPALGAGSNEVTAPKLVKPGVVPIAPPIRPVEDTELEAPAREPERPRVANFIGTGDEWCHVLVNVGLGGYTKALCGKRVVPPLSSGHAPPPARCPGGHPSCPDCAAAR
jgi:hypothetical protein